MIPPSLPFGRGRYRRPRWRLCLVIAAVITLLLALGLPLGGPQPERNLATIRAAIRSGEVLQLTVVTRESRIEGVFRGVSAEAAGTRFETTVPTEDLMTEVLNEVDRWNREQPGRAIAVDIRPVASAYFVVFLQTLPWLIFGGALIWLIWRHSRGISGLGGSPHFRSLARFSECERPRVTFADIAGIPEAKEEVYELIQFLQDPGRFTRLGGRIPRGILLVGPPGTGKTLLAKAVAGEACVPFYSISGSDFVEMFVGVGASRVRDLFRQARDHAPSIVFLDEIDAVGRRRGAALGTGSEEREQTLNAILVEMDGFDSDSGVIVIAATNRPDVLDPALLRPGRFDREICVDLPEVKGRREILAVHTARVPLDGVDLETVARGTPTFSGADLEALVNEAALIAAVAGRDRVNAEDLEEARDKVRWGRARHSRVPDEDERRVTAYHEAGHALLTHRIPEVEPLHKVTIIPRGPALGATLVLPERDRYQLSRATALGNLVVLLGGRAAEALFCGDISSGAQNDMERASELARRMVCEWGMTDRIGPVAYSASCDAQRDGDSGILPLGEDLKREIDAEIRRLVHEAYARAEAELEEYADDLRSLAEALLVRETLNRDEVEELLGERVGAASFAE